MEALSLHPPKPLSSTYTQNSNSTLTLNFPTSSQTPYGNILATGAITLDGTLSVTDTGNYMPAASTEIVLLKSSGTGKLITGTFSEVSLAAQFSTTGSVVYDYSVNEVLLQFSTCNGVWDGTSSGTGATPQTGTEAAPLELGAISWTMMSQPSKMLPQAISQSLLPHRAVALINQSHFTTSS